MPSRNVIKHYRNDAAYHVYNRGVNGDEIFVDDVDRNTFLTTLKERLPASDVGLIAYCLMPNHFHLVLWQYENDGVTRLMRSAMCSYVRKFNGRHHRYGPLFQSTFKAAHPLASPSARKVTAYVHLNPSDLKRGLPWTEYEFSSHKNFLDPNAPQWLDSAAANRLFLNRGSYEKFMTITERARKRLSREISGLWVP